MPPKLATHDRHGHRLDAVDYDESYHQLMRLGLEAGAASFAWQVSEAIGI
jgi:putative acyl-CoA dehydrogenase